MKNAPSGHEFHEVKTKCLSICTFSRSFKIANLISPQRIETRACNIQKAAHSIFETFANSAIVRCSTNLPLVTS